MTNMDLKDKYLHELAKIAYDAKHDTKWGLRLDDATVINYQSDTKTILSRISLLTPAEFATLTKGYDLEIKDMPSLDSYSTEKEEDGIYIEKKDPLATMGGGRDYAIIKGNKKLHVGVNTKNDKVMSAAIMDQQDDGIYIYVSSSDEIRFISNEKLVELCDLWRKVFPIGTQTPPNDEIIVNLTHTDKLYSLAAGGEVLANKVHNGAPVDEARLNYLFTLGIKEYMDMYAPRVVHKYETELDAVADWTR